MPVDRLGEVQRRGVHAKSGSLTLAAPKRQLHEPDEIASEGARVGEERLVRGALDILVTAVIGGAEVSLGGLVAMTVLGAALDAAPGLRLYGGLALAGLVFPIGFAFVILGRSELFTENFFFPVAALVARGPRPRTLARLWALSWAGNMIGCASFAVLVSVPEAVGRPILGGYAAYTTYKLSVAPLGVFASAVLAGAIMTILTWLLVAVRDPVARLLLIFGTGYLIFATNVSHAIVGAAVLLTGFLPAHRPFLEVARWLVIATVGNTIGGVGLVTMFRLMQVRAKVRRRGSTDGRIA